MSAGKLAALAVCVVVGAGAARAEDRRPVAVIDLSEDAAAIQLTKALYKELTNHWALAPTGTRDFDEALTGKMLDEDAQPLATAAAAKTRADDALLQLQYDGAIAAATEGLRAVATASPAKAAPVAADLAFDLGSAQLGLKHAEDALRWFALVHRLDPARRLDPVRFDPDTVAAYARAAQAHPARRKLTVRGTGRAWIDGADVGAAPASFEVDDGAHLVQLAGPARETRGKLIEHVARDQDLDIENAPAGESLLIERARRALVQAPADAVSRAPAMKHLAELLGVHDAVLIWKSGDGKLLVQTWRDRAPGFSALREHAGEPPDELLAPLAPPKPPPAPKLVESFRPPPFQLPKIEVEQAWYQKRWVQASVAGGVIAAIVGAVLIANHQSYLSFGMTHF